MILKLSKFRFKTRLLLGFSMVILLNGITVLISIQKMNNMRTDLKNIYKHPLAVSNAVREINGNINAIHRTMKDILLSENPAEVDEEANLINRYDKVIKQAFNLVFERFLGDMQDVERAYESYQQWDTIRAEVITLMNEGKRGEAIEITRNIEAKHVKKLFEYTQVMIDFAKSKADEFYLANQVKQKKGARLLIISLIFVFGVSIIFSLIISNSITTPINLLIARVRDKLKPGNGEAIDDSGMTEQKLLEHTVGLLEKTTVDLENFNQELEKKVEERTAELKKSRELLNITSKLAKVGGWELDLNTQKLVWTEETYRIHDIDKNVELSARDAFNFYDENSSAIISQAISNTIESGEAFDLDLDIVTAKGNKKSVNALGYLRTNGRKHLYGAFLDITEQKKVKLKIEEQNRELQNQKIHLENIVQERTEELLASNEELKSINEELYSQRDELEKTLTQLKETQAQLIQSEKMASLGVLVAGVAHEINNPINFISSSLNALKNNLNFLASYISDYQHIDKDNYLMVIDEIKSKEVPLSEVFKMFRKSIEIIGIGVHRTTKIVKSLKSFARANEKELENYNLHENIDNTLLILHHQYKERIKIVKEYDEIPNIVCYPGRINQVLMNILTNAIHAIENEGIIKISTSLLRDDKVKINIEDTGMGIPPENLKQIFLPFFTTKKVGAGTGLGLSISYNIIKEHKGEILVDSKEGEGSCFRIILPIK